MRGELALPAFQMDCRDWLVMTPGETGLPDEVAGAPLLAVLSSAVVGVDDFRSVSAVLTLGLLDEDEYRYEPGWPGRVAGGAQAMTCVTMPPGRPATRAGGMPVSRCVSRSVSNRSASSVQACTAGLALAFRRKIRSS